jgi:hypothetical protein
MIYVIVAIVLVVLIVGVVLGRRKTAKRGVSYAPNLGEMSNDLFNPGTRFNPHELPQVAVPTSEVNTESIAHDEFRGDFSDDLLDPHNPGHAAWVKEHPEMESDDEWTAEHPDETTS